MIRRAGLVFVLGGLATAAAGGTAAASAAAVSAVSGHAASVEPAFGHPVSGHPVSGYSASGLYNMGNAYARAGRPGMAVLNYERAALLAPGDPDIEANLALVRAASRLPPESHTGFVRAVTRAVTVAPPAVLAWLGVAGIVLAGAGVLAMRFGARRGMHARTRLRAACAAGIIAGVLLIGLAVAHAVVFWPSLHEAVVLAASAPVRVSPVPMGELAFELHEGETVRVNAQHEGFALVQTRGDRTGWVALADLAPVVPRN